MAGAQSAPLGLESDMEASQVDMLGRRETVQPFAMSRRTIVAVAGLLAMFVAGSVWPRPGIITKSNVRLFAELDEEGHAGDEGCEAIPFVRLDTVVSSNLGKKGPDTNAEEGIIYNASLHHSSVNISNLQIHIHSQAEFGGKDGEYDEHYEPEWIKGDFVNGKHGMFGIVNLKQGSSVKLRLHAYNLSTKEDIEIPVDYISFFDFDAGKESTHCIESVRIMGLGDYFITNETEIDANHMYYMLENVTTPFMTFTATKEGTGADNPTDPTSLTIAQKNKAVTIKHAKSTSIDFEIGASAGFTGRVFQFVLRPSLLCAKTQLADGSEVAAKNNVAPIEIVETQVELMAT